jgi:hypothetical protein
VLAIRNIVDCHTQIKNNIINHLKTRMLDSFEIITAELGTIYIEDMDIKIDNLLTFMDVKK